MILSNANISSYISTNQPQIIVVIIIIAISTRIEKYELKIAMETEQKWKVPLYVRLCARRKANNKK